VGRCGVDGERMRTRVQMMLTAATRPEVHTSSNRGMKARKQLLPRICQRRVRRGGRQTAAKAPRHHCPALESPSCSLFLPPCPSSCLCCSSTRIVLIALNHACQVMAVRCVCSRRGVRRAWCCVLCARMPRRVFVNGRWGWQVGCRWWAAAMQRRLVSARAARRRLGESARFSPAAAGAKAEGVRSER